MKRLLSLIWIPLFLLLLALGGVVGATRLQASLENYRPPDLTALVQKGPVRVTEPLSHRVVLVVVDGLREDTSYQMPFLNELRQKGISGSSRDGQPSYSKPGYAVISSGAWQETTGVTMNTHQGPLQVETMFQVARKAGLKTAMVADEWWGELNEDTVDFNYNYRDADSHDPATDEKAYADALKTLRQDRADLTLVHFCQVDTQGHAAGGAGTKAYLDAALHIDQFIKGIVGALDLSRDTIIVTSDHGHLTRNNRGGSGHGGWEKEVISSPLVLAGSGIRPSSLLLKAEQVDLAPTCTALLGLRAPAQSQGQILWAALDAPPRAQALLELERLGLNRDFTALYLKQAGSTLTPDSGAQDPTIGAGAEGVAEGGKTSANRWLSTAGKLAASRDFAGAFSAARQGNRQLGLLFSEARSDRVKTGRWFRLWVPFLAAAAAYLIWRRRQSPWFLPLLVSFLAHVALDAAFYAGVWHNTYSLGVFPDASLATFFKLFGWPGYLALTPIIGYWWVIAKRLQGPSLLGRGTLIEIILLGSALSQLVIFLLAYFWVGYPIGWPLPDFRVGFFEMSALLHLVFLGPLGIILPPLAWLMGLMTARQLTKRSSSG
ncbi:MAG: alkaline phosphatase family protein [Firmicutes bacterium]|nr:alkaline phosphatase family protein [Bacillota bacterium]